MRSSLTPARTNSEMDADRRLLQAAGSRQQLLHPLAHEMPLSCAFNPEKVAMSYSCDGFLSVTTPAEQTDESRKTHTTRCLVISSQMARD